MIGAPETLFQNLEKRSAQSAAKNPSAGGGQGLAPPKNGVGGPPPRPKPGKKSFEGGGPNPGEGGRAGEKLPRGQPWGNNGPVFSFNGPGPPKSPL